MISIFHLDLNVAKYFQGGSSIKVVDCILCLKGYHEWKLAGGIGVWRYGGLVKITSSSKGSPSSLLDGTSAELYDASTLPHNQQLLEILDLVTEVSLEKSNAANALRLLFDQFGLRLLQAFLTQYREAEDIHLNETVGKIPFLLFHSFAVFLHSHQ